MNRGMEEKDNWKNQNLGFLKVEKNPWVILLILLISIIGLFINGYNYDIIDHAIYIPMIDRAINPALFPNDYLFDEPSEGYNFWLPIMTFLARFFPLEWIFFVGYILVNFVFFWSIYHISLNLFGCRGAAAFAALLLIIPKPIGGTATTTVDIFFTLRSTALPIAIFFLIPYFRGRLVLSAIICGITFLIHPITAIPLILLLIFRLLIDAFRHNWRKPLKAFGVFLLCILPLLIRVSLIEKAGRANLSFFSRSDPQWVNIIKQRDSYIFFSAWGRNDFLSLLAYFATLISILLFRRWDISNNRDKSELNQEYGGSYIRETDLWAYGVVMVCAGLFIIGGIFVEWYPLPLVVQLQVVRSSYLMADLVIIYTAWLLWEGVSRLRKLFPKLSRQSKPYIMASQITYSLIGMFIPAYIATLFMFQSTNQLMLGCVSIICWWICFHFDRLHFLIRASGGIAWFTIMLFLRRFFVKAFSLQILYVVLIGFIFLGAFYFLANWRDWVRIKKVAAGYLLIITFSALITQNFGKLEKILTNKENLMKQINLPGNLPYSDWVDVQQWCKTNTPIEAMFFVPPDIQGFRIHSQRAIVGDWKDGAPSVFSETYARRWWERMEELKGYDSFDEARFNKLKEKYGASYAITRKIQRLSFPIEYQNNGFIVYALYH
jgi:hypothetical protein